MTDGEVRRREDAALRMEQKFQDFLVRYEENEDKAQAYRDDHELSHKALLTTLENRFEPLEDLYKTINRPAKIIGTILLLMMTPILGALGWGLFRWTVAHIDRILDSQAVNR